MKVSCNVILDLIPLVKDNVASEDSINLVLEHLKNCESCKLEFENDTSLIQTEFNDKRVVYSIKKKLFFAMLVLLFIGAFIGIALNKNSSWNVMTTVIVALGSIFLGIIVFKFDLKGGINVKNFFIGKAIGTVIIFSILGIYLLLKYGLNLF